jgi:hypothetical protein
MLTWMTISVGSSERLDFQQTGDHFLFLSTRFAGINLDNLFLVPAFKKAFPIE